MKKYTVSAKHTLEEVEQELDRCTLILQKDVEGCLGFPCDTDDVLVPVDSFLNEE